MAKGFGHGTGKDAHPFFFRELVLAPAGFALGEKSGKSLLSFRLHPKLREAGRHVHRGGSPLERRVSCIANEILGRRLRARRAF